LLPKSALDFAATPVLVDQDGRRIAPAALGVVGADRAHPHHRSLARGKPLMMTLREELKVS
jgi:hypothetical protein